MPHWAVTVDPFVCLLLVGHLPAVTGGLHGSSSMQHLCGIQARMRVSLQAFP